MSLHLSSAAFALLTLTAAVQAQQDRRFMALAHDDAYVGQRDATPNPSVYDSNRSRGEFGSFGAASVARTLGY